MAYVSVLRVAYSLNQDKIVITPWFDDYNYWETRVKSSMASANICVSQKIPPIYVIVVETYKRPLPRREYICRYSIAIFASHP
mmetsp:Transcript_23209/g.34614  ORF Transcript_23209/g.34614 Transcript_23209/m.34614 type:complete len:83 (+) Transcript_23209:71-319(+)